MKRLILPASALLLLGAGLACDLEKTGNQLRSQQVMVATLLATPPVELSPLAMAGVDGGTLPEVDGGTVTLPGHTAAFIFFGERAVQSLDSEPRPITGAQARVRPSGAQGTPLSEKGAGTYTLSSVEDERLVYPSGAHLLFEVQHGGQTYTGQVESAPELERIEAFHPPSGYIEHQRNQAFSFSRPAPPANAERNLGFVTVFPVGSDGQKGEPTWTNMPSTPLDFLKLVALPAQWKQDQVTIPGSAFPDGQQTYLVVLQAVKLGGPQSDNLFTGSAIMAGTAEVGVLRTRAP
jgi:hypothetical protein